MDRRRGCLGTLCPPDGFIALGLGDSEGDGGVLRSRSGCGGAFLSALSAATLLRSTLLGDLRRLEGFALVRLSDRPLFFGFVDPLLRCLDSRSRLLASLHFPLLGGGRSLLSRRGFFRCSLSVCPGRPGVVLCAFLSRHGLLDLRGGLVEGCFNHGRVFPLTQRGLRVGQQVSLRLRGCGGLGGDLGPSGYQRPHSPLWRKIARQGRGATASGLLGPLGNRSSLGSGSGGVVAGSGAVARRWAGGRLACPAGKGAAGIGTQSCGQRCSSLNR